MYHQKIIGILMTFLLLLMTACSTEGNDMIEHVNVEPSNSVDVEPGNSVNVVYEKISPDWPMYKSVDELIEVCDEVVLGRVTNISFQVLDIRTGKTPEAGAEEFYCYLYTIYDIDTIETYKGEPGDQKQVRVVGGVEGAYLTEQLAALEQEQATIYVLEDSVEISEGGTYLFMLDKYDDAIPTIVNVEQGIYDISNAQSSVPEQEDGITVRDIISSFGINELREFESIAEELPKK